MKNRKICNGIKYSHKKNIGNQKRKLSRFQSNNNKQTVVNIFQTSVLILLFKFNMPL